MEVATIEYCEPNLQSHRFQFKVCDQTVIVKSLRLQKSIILWIGSSNRPVLEDLSLSMSTPYGHDPLQTKLMGDVLSMTSMNLASRLSKN